MYRTNGMRRNDKMLRKPSSSSSSSASSRDVVREWTLPSLRSSVREHRRFRRRKFNKPSFSRTICCLVFCLPHTSVGRPPFEYQINARHRCVNPILFCFIFDPALDRSMTWDTDVGVFVRHRGDLSHRNQRTQKPFSRKYECSCKSTRERAESTGFSSVFRKAHNWKSPFDLYVCTQNFYFSRCRQQITAEWVRSPF